MFSIIEKVYAAVPPTITIPINNKGYGPTGLIEYFYNNGYYFLLRVGGVLAVVMMMWYGIKYLSSGGNPEKAKQAKAGVLNTIYGVVIAALAYLIVRVGTNIGNYIAFYAK